MDVWLVGKGEFLMSTKRKPILCLDFDGVIHSYSSPWVDAVTISDPPVPGAIEFLQEAVNHFRVAIYSTRSNATNGRAAMKEWLAGYSSRELVDSLEWPTEKPPALVTIDDRALTFTGVFPDIEMLMKFKPWNKTGC